MARIIFFLALLAAMSAYITISAHRLFRLDSLKKTPSIAAWLLSEIPAAAGLTLIPITGGLPASVIALGHLTALLVLCDTVLWLFRSERIDRDKWQAVLFAASFVLCTAYIAYGTVNAYVVTPTNYSVTTGKHLGAESVRIAHISDCHLGTTFDGDGFARHIEAINAQRPDVLVITGDFIDSRTTREEMETACAAFENVEAPLGVYYVAGNHEGRLSRNTAAGFFELLERHGVTVLADETVMLSDGIALCGRKDADDPSRRSVGRLMGSLDSGVYTVFLDHQPREYADYAAHGADLVLSGHTHAGQMFPLGMFIPAIGMGENTYGLEQRGDTTFIVSSGMSGLLPLRTEAKCEFVIIDVVSIQN